MSSYKPSFLQQTTPPPAEKATQKWAGTPVTSKPCTYLQNFKASTTNRDCVSLMTNRRRTSCKLLIS